MKCPVCGEWNYDYSSKCVKCGRNLPNVRKKTRNSSTTYNQETSKPKKGFWEENGHLIAHAALKLLFG